MSGSEIWNWLKENSLLLAAGLAVLGVIIVAIGLPHVAAFFFMGVGFMGVGLCLMLRTERDRNRRVP